MGENIGMGENGIGFGKDFAGGFRSKNVHSPANDPGDCGRIIFRAFHDEDFVPASVTRGFHM
jgi:hypothetical protein